MKIRVYIAVLTVLIPFSCKKENKGSVHLTEGRIKTIEVIDSIQPLQSKYAFFYDGDNGELNRITKDGQDYIQINPVSNNLMLVKRVDDTLGIEKYEIVYDGNKNVKSIKYILDSANQLNSYLFVLSNNNIDSIYEFGLFLYQFNIRNYNFVFQNGNCVSYTSTYDQQILSGITEVTETRTFIYNDKLNNKDIPFQSILKFPDIFITTPRGVVSLPYIASLMGLNVGCTNKNLLTEKGEWKYEYVLNDNAQVIEIREYSIASQTLYRIYKLAYY